MKKFVKSIGIFLVLFYSCGISTTLLSINVKNQGGDVFPETIISNVTEDIITLEFQRSDGTLVTQLIDFRNEVQIIRAVILGEVERGQTQLQVMCFVNHFSKLDFISSDAMSKLRQKNPGTVRVAEEDRGYTNYTMDLFIDINKSLVISKHISTFCSEAAESTFTRNKDLKLWIQRPGTSESLITTAVRNFTLPVIQNFNFNTTNNNINNNSTSTSTPKINLINKCADTSNLSVACSCSLELCIGWYPCGLKFCKSKNDGKKVLSPYRCGIKTCKKYYIFSYQAKMKQNCLWDE
ncbi:out at first protein [Microplitis mediator]|uniref:out at first protein n=1 Tax=Microplitis mediator TaxID=375433 RepID=UPI002557A2E1|nr:out at first protein [Microplitis mediator]